MNELKITEEEAVELINGLSDSIREDVSTLNASLIMLNDATPHLDTIARKLKTLIKMNKSLKKGDA